MEKRWEMGSVGGEEAVTDGDERILVSIRIRPLNDRERAKNDVSDWECINETTLIYRNNLSASDRSLYPTAYTFGRKTLTLQFHMVVYFFLRIMQSRTVYIFSCTDDCQDLTTESDQKIRWEFPKFGVDHTLYSST